MSSAKRSQQNPLHNILLNVVLPVAILSFLSKEKYLGALWGLIVALALPTGYGIHTLLKERRADLISILGVVSVLLTGVFGILKLPPQWITVKEAAVPLFIGIAIVLSLKTPCPLIRKMLMSEQLFNVDLLQKALRKKGNEARFEQRLVGLTWGLASSFFLSSALNYGLAKWLLTSEPGTEAFAAELGKMTGLSYVVITLPCMAVMIAVLLGLIQTLRRLTGLKLDDLLAASLQEPSAARSASVPEAE